MYSLLCTVYILISLGWNYLTVIQPWNRTNLQLHLYSSACATVVIQSIHLTYNYLSVQQTGWRSPAPPTPMIQPPSPEPPWCAWTGRPSVLCSNTNLSPRLCGQVFNSATTPNTSPSVPVYSKSSNTPTAVTLLLIRLLQAFQHLCPHWQLGGKLQPGRVQ